MWNAVLTTHSITQGISKLGTVSSLTIIKPLHFTHLKRLLYFHSKSNPHPQTIQKHYLRTMSDLKRTSNEAPLKDVIDRWLKAYGLDGKMKELDVINAWSELMGTAVAHRTKEIKIKNGTLYLKMDSSVMRDELSHGKQVIIQRVNERAGYQLINDVWFG